MLKSRLLFGFLMVVVLLAVLGFDTRLSPSYPLFFLAVTAIVGSAARELGLLLRQYPLPVRPWFCVVGSVSIIAGNWVPHLRAGAPPEPNILGAVCVFVGMGMLAFLLAAREYTEPGASVPAITGHLLAFFYVGMLGSFVVQLRWLGQEPTTGAIAFLLVIFVPKCGDIGAYFTGRRFGRTKLAPVLSPGKTIEGAIGGLIASVALAIGVVVVGEWVTGQPFRGLLFTAVLGLVLGVTGQLGDLMESLLKRDCRQKDASANIPGFGGILDVIDSVLFCGPVAYLFLVVFEGF